jgi:NADPH:quinone reductase-like Zn-dependent oxidoreductase
MKAIVYDRYGPPEVLRLADLPTPEPAEGQLLVRNRATAATTAEAAARSARPAFARLAFGLLRPKHRVLGSSVAGEVVALGAGVTGFAAGDAVVAEAGATMGGYAEYVAVPAASTVARPAAVSAPDAIAVTEGGLTALHFLRDLAAVRSGQHVLVNGAAGAIGSSAVQLARHFGATVTGVCGPANIDLVTDLGAVAVVDHTRADFTRARRAYDVVFDTVGKSSYGRARHALKPGGVYLSPVPGAAVGFAALWTKGFGPTRAVLGFAGLRSDAEKAHDLAVLLDLAGSGVLRPVIGRRFSLAETAAAHRYVDTGHKRGVALVTIDGS